MRLSTCTLPLLLIAALTMSLLTACGGMFASGGQAGGANPTSAVPPSPAQQAATAAFAKVENTDALPTSLMVSKILYRDWLTKPTPRAFALASDGSAYRTWGITTDPKVPLDVAERALHRCNKAGKKECKLYAVDNTVVWTR